MPTTTEPLQVWTRREGDDRVVVGIAGELDLSNHPQVRAALDKAIVAGPEVVELDLAELAFVDAAGLGVLIGCRRRAADRGVALVVRHPSEGVRRVLEATGLTEYLSRPVSIPA